MSAPHDRPDVRELIEAVRGFIEHEAAPALEGRLAFLARVAANALAIAERELELEDVHERAHGARLAALGVESDAELARRIRSGALDARYDEVAAAVRASVGDKLAVANPAYALTR